MSGILSQVINSGTARQTEVTAEEAQMSAVDMTQANMGIQHDHIEMTRLIDVANGLDNVVAVAGHSKAATRIELALVENSVALAFAGESVDSSQVTFGLEDCEGGEIACEGIKDVAIKIWTAIKNLMKRIRERVTKFFKSRWGAVASLRKSIEKLKERADKTIGKTIEDNKTVLGREYKALYVDGAVVKDEGTVVKNAEGIKTTAESVFFTYGKDVNTAGAAISKAMDSFKMEPAASKAALEAGIAAAEKLISPIDKSKEKQTTVKNSNDKRIPEGMEANKIELHFNQAIFAMVPEAASGTLREQADMLSKSRLMFTSSSEKPKKPNDEGTIATWSTATIGSICTALLDSLEAIERYDGSSVFKDIDSVNKDIQKAGDGMAKDLAAEDELAPEVNDAGKGLRSLATGYARWSSEGFTSYARYVIEFGNAMVVISNKCLSNYK